MPEQLTTKDIKDLYPDIYAAIQKDGFDAGRTEGAAAGLGLGRIEGATAERERIRAVEAQTIPGHEDLIKTLKYDGKTGGPEAAVAIVAAERALLANRANAFRTDNLKPLSQPEPGTGAGAVTEKDAGNQIHDLTKTKVAEKGISYGEAQVLVLKENPDLAAKYYQKPDKGGK